MDPDENLRETLALASSLQEAIENDRGFDPDDVLRLTELVIALDNWLANAPDSRARSRRLRCRGFPPARW